MRRLRHYGVPAGFAVLRDARVAGNDDALRGGLAHVDGLADVADRD